MVGDMPCTGIDHDGGFRGTVEDYQWLGSRNVGWEISNSKLASLGKVVSGSRKGMLSGKACESIK